MKFERSISAAGAVAFAIPFAISFDSLADALARLDDGRPGDPAREPAVGSGVAVTPADPDMPGAAKAAPDAAVGSPVIEGRILYVEDNFRIAEITEMMLEDLGLTVTWAPCAEDALKVIYDTPVPFDMVLTDVVMPGLSGVQLAKRIAQHWPDVPVVLTSGFSEELAQGYGSEYELLQKPFTRLALIECLQRYLGLHKA